MRIVSVERGRDPRRYAIVAFGGAGPVHAARLAAAVGAARVIVPFGAGVGSAIGLLQAAPKIETSVTHVLHVVPGVEAEIATIYGNLKRRANADLQRLGVGGDPVWSRYGYLRYRGQGYEIRADLPGDEVAPGFAAAVQIAFHDAYERSYGYRDSGAEVEAVDWHLVASLPGDGSVLDRGWRSAAGESDPAGERMAWFPESKGFITTAIYDRRRVGTESDICGPAIIEDPESTIVVPPETVARVDPNGYVIIEIGAGK